jgi:hypothetical protein
LKADRSQAPIFLVWRAGGAHQVDIANNQPEAQQSKLLDEIHPREIVTRNFMAQVVTKQ